MRDRLRQRHPATIVLVALIAAVFFFTPMAVWVFGVRAEQIENRPFTPLPHVSDGWDGFDQLTQWGIDRLPLRADAIRWNNDLTEKLFHELPTIGAAGGPVGVGQTGHVGGEGSAQTGAQPRQLQVIEGSDGWLFYGDEFVRACTPEVEPASVVDGLRRLGDILRASGRELVFATPPDKHTLSGRFLPSDLPEKACARRADDERHALLKAAALPGWVDMRTALETEQAKTGRPIYLPRDTHWDGTGDMVFARAVADQIDPALLRETRFVPLPEPTRFVGDLTAMTGQTTESEDDRYGIERSGVRPLGEPVTRATLPNYPLTTSRYATSRGGAELVRQPTLLYGDSFSERSLNLLQPFFARLTRIPELSRAVAGGVVPQAERELIAQIEANRLIVLEQVERTLWGARDASIVQPQFLDQLAAALGVER